MTAIIQTNNLSKMYGRLRAVDRVSLTIEKGSIVGLVGRNGAGKTTLIRLLTGLTKPTFGSFAVLPDKQRTATSVAAMVEKPSFYLNLNAKDNLISQCKLLGIAVDDAYLEKTLQLVKLSNTSQKAKNFSLGMKQRLAIAMTLVGKPELLILDEPTNGLDPEGIRDMRELFVTLNKEMGITIVISSHILSELQKIATEFYIMDKGKLLKHLTEEELESLSAKRLRITVSDVAAAQQALSALGKTVVVSENTLELYGDVQPTETVLLLAQNGVSVSNIVNVNCDLEELFMGTIGGAKC